MSLTPKTFIPLDRKIQEAVWEAPLERDGFAFLQQEETWMYRLAGCLFHKRRFDEGDREFFDNNKDLLESKSLREKLDLVVFLFASPLLDLIREGDHDRIVPAYFSFTAY